MAVKGLTVRGKLTGQYPQSTAKESRGGESNSHHPVTSLAPYGSARPDHEVGACLFGWLVKLV